MPTSNSGIYCSKEKKASKSRLADLQPNYSYPNAGIPKKTGKQGSKAAFVPLCLDSCSIVYEAAKNPFLHLIAKIDHKFVVNI